MDKPMVAMRACTDELLDHWGLDPAVQRTLSSKATPLVSPLTWLKPDDFPTQPLMSGKSALVRFRLTVDSDGSPTDCAVQSATLGPKYAETTCSLLKARAKFNPARDKDGKPTASYYTSTVSWIVI